MLHRSSDTHFKAEGPIDFFFEERGFVECLSREVAFSLLESHRFHGCAAGDSVSRDDELCEHDALSGLIERRFELNLIKA